MQNLYFIGDNSDIDSLYHFLRKNKNYNILMINNPQYGTEVLNDGKKGVVLLNLSLEETMDFLQSVDVQKIQKTVVVLSENINPDVEKTIMGTGKVAEILPKNIEGEQFEKRFEHILNLKSKTRPSLTVESILIVDDEDGIRKFLSLYFTKKGFATYTASSGEEALACLKQNHPNVILLDVMMPGMDGIETLREIRKINPEIGVVMATGLQDETIAKQTVDLGAYAYVVKPFDMQYLDLVVLTRLLLAA